MATDIESQRPDDETEQERHPPAPAVEGFGSKRPREESPEKRTCERREPLADHLPGTVKSSPMRRSAFDKVGGGAGELASGRKALQQTSKDDEQRRRDADRGVSRGKSYQRDRDRHQGDDQQQSRLSTVAVGIDAEQHAADRTHEKADAECRRGEQQRGVLAVGGKEKPRDDHGEEAKDDEVV